jgi:Uncharacterized Fe-S center protein
LEKAQKVFQENELVSRADESTTGTTIFYYTGTGNSLWAGRALARKLGNTQLISMVDWETDKQALKSTVIGLVFPVHIWGVPRRVLNFLDELRDARLEYIFAVATNGGQVSNTLVQLKKVMDARHLALGGGWSVVMPSNYIPWGGPGPLEEQNVCFQEAESRLSTIAGIVRNRVIQPVEKGPLWQRLVFTALYHMTFTLIPKMDEKFWTDERCNHCSVCINICPTHNIALENGILTWHNCCEQCLACIQWCPQEALQYGKKTPAYARYHHPEVILKDLMK